jgi:hypothetical protein
MSGASKETFSELVTTTFAMASGSVSTAVNITDAPFSFTEAQLSTTLRAVITSIDQAIMITHDGATTPTAEIGHYIGAGQNLDILGATNIGNLKFVAVTGTAKVTVSLQK